MRRTPLSISLAANWAVTICAITGLFVIGVPGSASAAPRRAKASSGSGSSGSGSSSRSSSASAPGEDDADKDEGKNVSASLGAKAAGQMCISADTPKRVSECPKNAPKQQKGKGAAPSSKLQEAKRKVEQPKGFKAGGPSIELDVATLRNKEKTEKKARDLLLREIQVTKRLIKNTKTTDNRRPDFLLRLAEGYFELVQVATSEVRKLDEPIHQACQVKKDKGQCNALMKKQKDSEQDLADTREENIKTLAMLVKDHPNYKKMDEVLFSLGFSLDEMKQFDRARQVYHRLIKSFPQSDYVPNAYLSFAEYYFQQGDMRAAQQFYQKVTEIPPEKNKVYGYAIYKQAWCYYNLEDYKASLQSFIETIQFGTQNPEAPNVENLVRQSRKELVMPYAQVGSPERALEFFKRYAKDDDQAYTMFENLGELYFDTGKWPEVIAVYHGLMAARSTDDKVCYWQTRVTNAIVSSKPKAAQVTEVERMIDLYDTYQQGTHKEDAKKTCKQAAASVLIDLATAWHREAIGTDTQPGTNDRNTMDLASKLYRLLLKEFPEMESMEFPDIDKRDWPTEYKVAYYYAELLWKMENWGECGPAFDKVLEVNPAGEFTADAAYAAVLCYNKQYQQSFAQNEKSVRGKVDKSDKPGKGKKKKDASAEDKSAEYRAKEFSPTELGMLNAFQRYVCFVPDSEDLPQIKYRRARIYYETNHFEEASVLFKDIAFNHKDTDLGVYAANLYLDSLNVLGTYSEPQRPACYDEMNENIEPLFGLYCGTPEKHESNAELCNVLEQLRCDLLRKKAEALQNNKEFKQSATVYVSIFRKFRECGKLDEVLYNASINFEAARLLGRAIKVRKVLIDKYPESEWAKRALYLIGANFHALAIYDTAADYYEQFAVKYPGEDGKSCSDSDKAAGTCAIAHEALQNAIFFRLGLGDEEKGVEDAKTYEKNYSHKFPRETSRVKYSLGSVYERQQDWNKVITHYTGFINQYKKTAMPDELIQANVNVGRAYLALAAAANADKAKKTKEPSKEKPVLSNSKAEPFFKAAAKIWSDGAPEAIAKSELPDDQKARSLAYAKIAVAEALFNLANADFDKFAAIKFPVFKATVGKKDSPDKKQKVQEQFTKWMGEDFVKWMGEKAKALDGAQKAYEKISDLKVPQWDIASATRIGDMYLSFVDDFRDAPVPPTLQGDDELVDIYYQGLDEASKPWVEKAKNAYEFCLITATKVRWFNEFMTRCEQELFKLDPRAYPRAAELRGSDTYTYSAEAKPSMIELSVGGEEDLEGGK